MSPLRTRASGILTWILTGLAAAALFPALLIPAQAQRSPAETHPTLVEVEFLSISVGPLPAAPGHTPQSYIGIDVRDVTEDLVASLRLHDTHGAVIVRVDHDGPAGKAGLRERDVILTLNGASIDGEEPLRRMLRDLPPGRTAALVLLRDGQTLNISVQMADRDKVEQEAWKTHLGPQAPAQALPGSISDTTPQPDSGSDTHVNPGRYGRGFLGSFLSSPSYTGAMLEMMGPQLAEFFGLPGNLGLLVRSVEPGSPAAQAGMRAGDVVLRANSQPVASMADWSRLIREAKGHPLTVSILRDHAERTLTLTPDGKRRSSLHHPPSAPAPDTRLAFLQPMLPRTVYLKLYE